MKQSCTNKIFPGPEHNHQKCLGDAIEKARTLFAARKQRLTPLREEIYRQVLTSHNSLGAYQIRDQLNKNDRNIAPITIYRILELLCEIGLIHRIESQNTYYACHQNHHGQNSKITLICRACGTIAELLDETIDKAFGQLEKKVDFITENRILEIEGLCPECRQTEQPKC